MLTAAALAMGTLTGCAIKQPPAPDPVSHAPLIVDEAMQQRKWNLSVAHYANGQAPGWPTGFIFVHDPREPNWQGVITDSPMFIANIFAMPFGYAFNPPWTPVNYPRGEIEPSYHAMPPLGPQ